MRVIARKTLSSYLESRAGHKDYPALKSALTAWFQEASKAEWKDSAALKAQYASASIVSNDRVVFNIKGNSYRLIVAIDYTRQVIFIKWVGSHREYDKIDAEEVQYGD
ncbi:MAG TPA: type II toxin-antitoxin system HigB family toxin [Pantanalinema sp.]